MQDSQGQVLERKGSGKAPLHFQMPAQQLKIRGPRILSGLHRVLRAGASAISPTTRCATLRFRSIDGLCPPRRGVSTLASNRLRAPPSQSIVPFASERNGTTSRFERLLLVSQGQNMALAVLCVPNTLDGGTCDGDEGIAHAPVLDPHLEEGGLRFRNSRFKVVWFKVNG